MKILAGNQNYLIHSLREIGCNTMELSDLLKLLGNSTNQQRHIAAATAPPICKI